MVAKLLIVLFSIVALTFAAPVDQEDHKEVIPQAVPVSTDDQKAAHPILLVHPPSPLPQEEQEVPKPQDGEKDLQQIPNVEGVQQLVYPNIPLPEDQEGPQGDEKDDLKTDASYWGWGYYRPYYRSYYGGYRWRYPYYYGGWGGHYW